MHAHWKRERPEPGDKRSPVRLRDGYWFCMAVIQVIKEVWERGRQ